MPIQTSCPACGHSNYVATTMAGLSVQCLRCNATYETSLRSERVTSGSSQFTDTAGRRRTTGRGDQVAVPRRVLYLQGAIMLGLAIASFILGAIFGAGPVGPSHAAPIHSVSAMPDRTAQVPISRPAQAMISRLR